MSYSRFNYSDIRLSSTSIDAHSPLSVSALISNQSDQDGTEIGQLYVSDMVASVTRPVRELKGFQRIELAAGESRRVSFSISAADLPYCNASLE